MSNKIDSEHHLKLFADAFVLEGRRDRWRELLAERPDTIFMYSSKLFNYLDHNLIAQNDSLEGVAANDEMGVFYDFKTTPQHLSFEQAKNEDKSSDAFFSIIPGKLVVYFYHGDWNFVCKKQ